MDQNDRETATARVTITVNCIRSNPNAVDDEATTPENQSIDIPVLDNDSDPGMILNPFRMHSITVTFMYNLHFLCSMFLSSLR